MDICAVINCGRRGPLTRGYCGGHYKRLGSPKGLRPEIPLQEYYPVGAICEIQDCERERSVRGMCRAHYQRWRLQGDALHGGPIAPRSVICSVDDCEKSARGRGWCGTHYERWRRMGDPNWIPELSLSWNRRITSSGYVEIACEGFYYYEHRLVWESRHGALLPGQNIHHRNGDRADNRIENLEVWDTSQPAGQRAADKLAYAMEMIRRYGAPALLVDMGITSAV